MLAIILLVVAVASALKIIHIVYKARKLMKYMRILEDLHSYLIILKYPSKHLHLAEDQLQIRMGKNIMVVLEPVQRGISCDIGTTTPTLYPENMHIIVEHLPRLARLFNKITKHADNPKFPMQIYLDKVAKLFYIMYKDCE